MAEFPLSIEEQGAGLQCQGAFLVMRPVVGAQEREDFAALCPLHVMAAAGTEAEQDDSLLPLVAFLMNGDWRVAATGGGMEHQADGRQQ